MTVHPRDTGIAVLTALAHKAADERTRYDAALRLLEYHADVLHAERPPELEAVIVTVHPRDTGIAVLTALAHKAADERTRYDAALRLLEYHAERPPELEEVYIETSAPPEALKVVDADGGKVTAGGWTSLPGGRWRVGPFLVPKG